jgi:acetyl esterase/lipase
MVRMERRLLSLITPTLLALTLTTAMPGQQTTLPLWPHGTPEPAQTTTPEADVTKDTDAMINGHRSVRLANVSVPTMTVYSPPAEKNNGSAALVFPGGGYQRLAWTGEGTDVCDWLNSIGMTCLLVKYRVPQPPGDAGHYPADHQDLEDAQQAMRLARQHASEWHIDVSHIGVIGFSAGANLAVLMSTHPDDHSIESTPAARDIPKLVSEPSGGVRINGLPDARPAFAIVVYPAYLAMAPDMTTLDPVYAPNQFTPPTFLIQAEDDKSYGRNAPVYYQALAAAGIPAELHMFATGGHGFGIRPPGMPEEHWTRLAGFWLHSLGMMPAFVPGRRSSDSPSSFSPAPTSVPCPIPQPPQPGNPNPQPGSQSASTQPTNPNCP